MITNDKKTPVQGVGRGSVQRRVRNPNPSPGIVCDDEDYSGFYIGTRLLGLHVHSKKQLIETLEEGLKVSTFHLVQQELDVRIKVLAHIVSISTRTISRRKKEGFFKLFESEKLYQISSIIEMAKDVFEDDKKAITWLKTPNSALEGKTPLEYSRTVLGADEVMDMLGRLEHGVFA